MIYILTLTFFILQCLDWYTTRTIINGGGYEENPIMAWLFKKANMDLVLFLKTVILSVIGYLVGTQIPLALVFLVIVYIAVVYHNWKSL